MIIIDGKAGKVLFIILTKDQIGVIIRNCPEVEEIRLSTKHNIGFMSIRGCKNVSKIIINNRINNLNINKEILSKLTELKLYKIKKVDMDIGCFPNLENLTLCNCGFTNPFNIPIDLCSLKTLMIESCNIQRLDLNYRMSKLEYFSIKDNKMIFLNVAYPFKNLKWIDYKGNSALLPIERLTFDKKDIITY